MAPSGWRSRRNKANDIPVRKHKTGGGVRHFTTPWRADGNTYLGCCYVRDYISDEWIGAIDDLRFYDDALSVDEVKVIYEEQPYQ